MKRILFLILCLSLIIPAYADDELKDAYDWAYKYNITTQSYENANLWWELTRQAMAKMIVNFSTKILWETPNSSVKCNFEDLSEATYDLIPYIKQACQLWVMGQNTKNFNPHGTLTRAQFWTLLSRALWWNKYEWWEEYYSNHLIALKRKKIMEKIDNPQKTEIRGYVMLMLKRSSESVLWTTELKTTPNNESQNPKETKEPESKHEEKPKEIIVPYTLSWVSIKIGNWDKIVGDIYLPNPKKNKKLPLIIFSHWLWQTRSAWEDYAKTFASSWFAVYTFDFRWWGPHSESDGPTTNMSILTEFRDLTEVVKQAKTRDFVDTGNIVLMGISQWWLVSALVSAEIWNEIKWTILFYPAFSIQETVKSMFNSLEDIPNSYDLMWQITVWRKYAEDIREYDILGTIEKDTKKILIVHGNNDYIVSLDSVEEAAERYKNADLHILNWAMHGFSWNFFTQAIWFVRTYLKELWINS